MAGKLDHKPAVMKVEMGDRNGGHFFFVSFFELSGPS